VPPNGNGPARDASAQYVLHVRIGRGGTGHSEAHPPHLGPPCGARRPRSRVHPPVSAHCVSWCTGELTLSVGFAMWAG